MKSPVRWPWPALTRILAGMLMLTVAIGLTPTVYSTHSPVRAEPQILPAEDDPPDPPRAHEVQLALVVPLSVPPAENGLLDAIQLNDYIADGGYLNTLLRLATSNGLSLAIDPYLIHSLIVAENPATEAFLQQLRQAPTDKFLMSYANTPVAYLDAFPDATDVLSGNVHQLETMDIQHPLLDTMDQSLWSPNDLLNPETLHEVPDAVRRVFLPSTQLPSTLAESEELEDRYRAAESLNEVTAYFTHQKASEAFTTALENPSQSVYHDFIRLVRFDLPTSQSELIIAPAFHERLPELIEQLSTQFNIHLVSLSTLNRHPVSTISSQESFDDFGRNPDLVNDIAELIRNNARATAFLTALDIPDIATAQYQLFALQSVSQNYSGSDLAAAQIGYINAVNELEHSITLEPGSDITLITPETHFGVSVNNALVSTAEVVIVFHASNNRIAIPERVTVTVDGHSKQTVTVPIAAYANGQATISLTLYSKNGVQLGQTQQLQVQIQAEVELVALIVFFVLVSGFITAGIIRSIRKRSQPGSHQPSPTRDESDMVEAEVGDE